jgi:hypothetical protein
MNNTNQEETQQNTQNVNQPVLEMSAVVADLEQQAAALKAKKAKKGPSTPEPKTASNTTPSVTVSPARSSS